MKIDLFNIDEFVKQNHCPEITNPMFWNYDTTPTSDGLFSYELFGVSDEERKNIFGYIDLKGHYIHPMIWLMIQKRMGALGDVANGNKYAVIADKKIKIVKEDFPGAETGIDFLYDNFEKINWFDEIQDEEIDSIDKKTRLKFLESLKKEEFFVDKWLVLPPFYRAESSTNRSMGDSINKLYKELISRVKGMNVGFSFNIFGAETKLRIQNILKDIYLSTCAPISGKNLILEKGKVEGELKGTGKNSMIRKHLIGKTVDWGASSVITSPPNSRANTIDDKPVPFGYGAFPLSTLLSLFQPFFVNYCCDNLQSYLDNFAADFAPYIKRLDNGQFSATVVEKMIKKFIKAPQNRFDPIEFKFIDKNGKTVTKVAGIYEYFSENDAEKNVNYTLRPLTLTDLFYIAAMNVLNDKHVYVTRFPVADFQNIYPSKIKVLSTSKTSPRWIRFTKDGAVFYNEKYPTIPKYKTTPGIDSGFYDVMLCGNAYLASLGGDYDLKKSPYREIYIEDIVIC